MSRFDIKVQPRKIPDGYLECPRCHGPELPACMVKSKYFHKRVCERCGRQLINAASKKRSSLAQLGKYFTNIDK